MSHRIDHLTLTCLAAIGIALLSYPAGAMPGGGGGGGGGGGMSAPQRQETSEERAATSYKEGERARGVREQCDADRGEEGEHQVIDAMAHG